MASTKKICDTCLRFPWHNLPAEDAGGQQHHSSRRLLEVSAQACPVCNLVLRAAVANYRDSRGTRNGRGYWRQHNCIHYKDASGLHQMNVIKELGVRLPVGQITPSKDHSKTIVSCVPMQEVGAMAPGYRTGQTILTPTGPVNADFSVGIPMPDLDRGSRDLEAETSEYPVWVYGNWWCHRDPRKAGLHPHLMGVGARFGRTASPWDAANTKPGKVHIRGSNIRLCTNNGSSFEHIPGRIIENNSSSPAAFRRLKAWINDCVTGHPACSSPGGDPILPRRVLDLNTAHSFVSLIETSNERAKYVTLSHNWRKSSCITTTSTNLSDHKHGIALSHMPPTIREAITIARQLGIRYLWAECLCIIQDDPADKQSEMASVGGIFSESYLTISAAHANDSYDGCFPLRSRSHVASPATRSLGYTTSPGLETFSIGFLTGQGAPSFVHLFEDWLPGSSGALPQFSSIGAFGQEWDPIKEEPLSANGWAHQERLLSRRTIHYAMSQMYFECQCGLQSEDGFHIPNTNFNFPRLLQKERFSGADCDSTGSQGPSYVRGSSPRTRTSPRSQGGWLSLIEDYSRRQFAGPAEKLTAIAGAARLLAEHGKDEYLAGLWRSHILEDLFWRTKHPCEDMNEDKPFAVDEEMHTQQHRVPSWSWAASRGPIIFEPLDGEVVAQVTRCQTQAAGLDPYGAVSDGELEILAPLYELCAASSPSPSDDHATPVYVEKTLDDGQLRKFSGLFFQDSSNAKDCLPCYALFLDAVHALVLKPQNTSGQQPQILTTELVRDRTETELPNWGWRCNGNMVRLGIAEFTLCAVGDGPSAHIGDWAEDAVSALSLEEPSEERQMIGPAGQDDVRISVVIK